ncbi:MAG: metallophosphoesterase [Bacteroidales bacterium]|nr:metallophosphoesterase [Bacteroidales bacterium]MDD3665596.1 metallophosphoesterase [Bacteroidales bacterium]
MKIQYCSDLHLEFDENRRWLEENPLRKAGQVLILAGDIVPLKDEFLGNPFFVRLSSSYEQVYWVPGNHEHYYNDVLRFGQEFNKTFLGNIHLVNNVELEYQGVRFVFSTLWSEISPPNQFFIQRRVADFGCISYGGRSLRTDDFNVLHHESVGFLEAALQPTNTPTVVVTHHLPSHSCNDRKHGSSPINEAFCRNLDHLIRKSRVNFWIHGHSHFNHPPVLMGKTFLVTNQLGYTDQQECTGYRSDAFFAL